ncbi:MAG: hypothetical protein C4K47_04730 [Candidatus Thorarchaeota archaeon]|nr:MAG: hypothetical protein C4K47_04730 [Candidatus Thorarchaeota archaeon]
MSRVSRDVPKEIAAFGEKQFSEAGALSVDVLRIKESTLRKYFKQLHGVMFVAAVVNQDRVRLYFFSIAGIMLGAENVDNSTYEMIRNAARLLAKFEKPKEPTVEELRMEATEEFRSSLSRAMHKTARALGRPDPRFPNIFVTKERLGQGAQSFGMQVEKDGTLLFEEAVASASWSEGAVLRASFLLLVGTDRAGQVFSQCAANGIAYSLLKSPQREQWLDVWRKNTAGKDLRPIVNHFVKHSECYGDRGFQRVLSLLESIPVDLSIDKCAAALGVIHDGYEVPLGTDDYHHIRAFCDSLKNPRKLHERRHLLESAHLAPRAVCNTVPLGKVLSVVVEDTPTDTGNSWLTVSYLDGSKLKNLTLRESSASPVTSLEYYLNIEDTVPKPGGILSQGRDLLRWALESIGVKSDEALTHEARLEFKQASLDTGEEAVLERLLEGRLKVLANSITGSLHRVVRLVESGNVLLLPDFGHLGIRPEWLLYGVIEDIRNTVRGCCLEATILARERDAHAIVSAPGSWGQRLVGAALSNGLVLFPVTHITSPRGVLREEDVFPEDPECMMWTQSVSIP